MGAGLVSFIFTVGVSTWIYSKLQRTSGNNTKQSLTAVGIGALFIFLVSFYIFHLIIK